MGTDADPNTGGSRGRTFFRRATDAARSSSRRYPRELLDSVRNLRTPDPRAMALPDPESPLGGVWLGHASVLLRVGGAWVLTDPVFSERIGVRIGGLTIGPGRLLPTLDPRTLPPIDLILLSHAHFDHLDRPTLRALAHPRTQVITAAKTRGLIPRGFGGVHEVHWEREARVGPLRVRALRPAHWGARAALDRSRGFNSYVIDAPDVRRRVLFSGDTAYTRAFERVDGADLTIFGIGAYDPWEHAHATPEQAWEMHRQAGGGFLLPMHHSTFRLSDEPLHEPMQRLLQAAGKDAPRVVSRALGDVWTLPGAA